MINGHRVLAVVLARGGSTGLPGKNLMPLAGRPVIAWSILAGQESALVDRTIVSTDDPAIAAAAKQAGGEIPFLRPPELAAPEATVHGALIHALDHVGESYDYIVALQATSPLRRGEDIDRTLKTCVDAGAPVCISVSPCEKSIYWSYHLGNGGQLRPVMGADWHERRRQDLPPVFAPNGAVYVARVDWYRRNRTFIDPATVACVMPRERSLDIDTAFDLKMIAAVFDR